MTEEGIKKMSDSHKGKHHSIDEFLNNYLKQYAI